MVPLFTSSLYFVKCNTKNLIYSAFLRYFVESKRGVGDGWQLNGVKRYSDVKFISDFVIATKSLILFRSFGTTLGRQVDQGIYQIIAQHSLLPLGAEHHP